MRIRRAICAALLLSACGKNKGVDDTSNPGSDDTAATDDTGDMDDTGDTGTPGSTDWTTGPDLPDCTPQSGSGERVALSGVLLTLDGPEQGLVVYSRSSGLIECVGADCDTTDAEILCTEGVITPGLIDAHNHLQYNVIPPWQHDALYSDRYDWQSDGDYWDYRSAYDDVSDTNNCEIMKWAELRDLVGGATSAVGSHGGSCIDVLVRNLDEDSASHGFDDYYLYYSSGKVAYLDEDDGQDYTDDLNSGYYDGVLNHVAEGVNGAGTSEIDHMVDIGMDGPGEQWVHATDATTMQLAQMRMDGAGIIWSPRSNLDLYANTTPADIALRMGVPVALGPDWTWSGSMNPYREMACAHDFLLTRGDWMLPTSLDVKLWEMTTTDAARAVGLDGVIGALEAGMTADISVFDWSDQPYRSIIQATSDNVRLVIIDAESLYGVPELVQPTTDNPEWCEEVDVCDTSKLLCVQSASSGDDAQTYDEIQQILEAALASASSSSAHPYASELHGLWMCEEQRDSCDITQPGDGDADGDGVQDGGDLCPDAWDPYQTDLDGDGVGDVCDPCPLNPVSDSCTYDSDDIDGDGYATADDDCPYVYDNQSDRDGDGKGDACDNCPDDANPGDAGCPSTIHTLRDPTDPNHPDEGDEVTISDVVVVGVRDGNGFYVQDPDQATLGGLFVYDGGDAHVSVGDVVSVSGEYTEYYGLTEVAYADVTVTGSATPPSPISVSPCDVGTGDALAESYESMLVVVADVAVSSSNPDGSSDYGEFELDGCLRVDDELWDGLVPQPAVGTAYDSLTGVLTYRYENSKLEPRSADDVDEAR